MRRALLIAAKADPALTGIVPAASIDPDGEPSWPFILAEAPRAQALRAACVRGATATFDLHAFARQREVAGAVVETGYDHVSRIGGALEKLFGETRIALETGPVCKITLSDVRILRDGIPDDQHWFAQVNARVLAA